MAVDEVHEHKGVTGPSIDQVKTSETSSNDNDRPSWEMGEEPKKMTFWQTVKEPGSVYQIIGAALLAVAIALPISMTMDTTQSSIQDASTILNIPGRMWLRALTAVGK
jgi:hypothetical protein